MKSTKYEQKYTDEVILDAIEELLKNPTVNAPKVARKLNANPVHIRRLLLDMKKRKVLKGHLEGKTWEFCLK